MTLLIAALPAFLASFVEFVEALTIILAIGVTRGWRTSLQGALAAIVLLVAAVAAFGPSISRIDPQIFQTVVGSLLLLVGVRWLRKAVLRYAGVLPLRDEAKKFAEAEARYGDRARDAGYDWAGASATFQGTLLEGLEVVLIVLALGAKGGHAMLAASIGAVSAGVIVAALGFVVRKPLARVPENTLKFLVGVMLSSFGTFWAGEGLGVAWPGGDATLLVLVVATLTLSGVSVQALRTESTA